MVRNGLQIGPDGPRFAASCIRRCCMLRDRYDPINLFEYIPALSMETDAVLTQLDTLLDDDMLFQAVKHDLSRRFPRTCSFGRPSTPVEVILRMIVVKHLYDWSYEQTEQWV